MELDHITFDSAIVFDAKVNTLLTSMLIDKPKGNKKPRNKAVQSYSYDRDPYVKAWVLLQRAAGICECCKLLAPFKTSDGRFFLEVHHLIPLVDNGPDTVENCIGVYPNCHRMLHYGQEKGRLSADLTEAIREKEASVSK
jgi:5-methylcytosine-specific restriction protein A